MGMAGSMGCTGPRVESGFLVMAGPPFPIYMIYQQALIIRKESSKKTGRD
jgi:hypothetical protein